MHHFFVKILYLHSYWIDIKRFIFLTDISLDMSHDSFAVKGCDFSALAPEIAKRSDRSASLFKPWIENYSRNLLQSEVAIPPDTRQLIKLKPAGQAISSICRNIQEDSEIEGARNQKNQSAQIQSALTIPIYIPPGLRYLSSRHIESLLGVLRVNRESSIMIRSKSPKNIAGCHNNKAEHETDYRSSIRDEKTSECSDVYNCSSFALGACTINAAYKFCADGDENTHDVNSVLEQDRAHESHGACDAPFYRRDKEIKRPLTAFAVRPRNLLLKTHNNRVMPCEIRKLTASGTRHFTRTYRRLVDEFRQEVTLSAQIASMDKHYKVKISPGSESRCDGTHTGRCVQSVSVASCIDRYKNFF